MPPPFPHLEALHHQAQLRATSSRKPPLTIRMEGVASHQEDENWPNGKRALDLGAEGLDPNSGLGATPWGRGDLCLRSPVLHRAPHTAWLG